MPESDFGRQNRIRANIFRKSELTKTRNLQTRNNSLPGYARGGFITRNVNRFRNGARNIVGGIRRFARGGMAMRNPNQRRKPSRLRRR